MKRKTEISFLKSVPGLFEVLSKAEKKKLEMNELGNIAT